MFTLNEKIFLSHAHDDKDFVEKVYQLLPFGIAYIYTSGFKNGEGLISQMEQNVSSSTFFVLFASKKSLSRVWVGFEIDRARLESIKRQSFRILIFPADAEVQVSDLPDWMRDLWFDNRRRNAHDVARAISNTVASELGSSAKGRVFGRGKKVDDLEHQFAVKRRELGGTTNANIVLAAGLQGNGRQTLIKETLIRFYPGVPTLANGPTIDMPIWAEAIDIYRSVRELVEDAFDLEKFEKDKEFFEALSETKQAEEIVESLLHFSRLGEAVFLRVPSALFEKTGRLKRWAKTLLNEIMKHPALVVCFVSFRQIATEDTGEINRLFQMYVPGLSDEAITTLIDTFLIELGIQPPTIDPSLLLHIGGHPMLARAYVRLVEQYGSGVFERSPSKVYQIQESILKDNLSADLLTQAQQQVLHVLSWLPKLDGKLLEAICAEEGRRGEPFADELNDLILGCLVETHGSAFSISGAVRSMFRRRFGFGSDALLGRLADEIKRALDEENAAGTLRSDTIDAVTFIYALEGKTLPDAFKKLLLPSTLEMLVRDAYNSGRENAASYDTAIRWGVVAENMRMDEGTREEILGTVVRSYIRQEEFDRADALLKKIEQRGYRSKFFLRGFWFARDGEASKAIPLLEQAAMERRYRTSAINQLGICYYRTGAWLKLNELVNVESQAVKGSAFLLDLKAQFLTGSGDYKSAELVIQQLSRLPEDDDRSQKRRAMLLVKRDKNYDEAINILTRLVDSKKGRLIDLRFVRGIIAAKAGRPDLARDDAGYIGAHAKRNAEEQVAKIEVRISLKEGDWRSAMGISEKIRKRGAAEELTRAEILDQKSRDTDVALSDRQAAAQESQAILLKHKNYSDIDFVDS